MTDVPADGASTRVSLRTELGGAADPDFLLVLPPGWERRAVNDAERDRMLSAMRTRLMNAQRPEIYARMQTLMRESFDRFKKTSTVAMFVPSDPGESGEQPLILPASLTAGIQKAEPGQTLDAFVRNAIARDGATPLFQDKRFLRVERDKPESLDGERFITTTVAYMTPIPGSGRQRALLLTLVLLRPEDVPADDEPMVAMKALFDMCVSSLTWVPAA